ncbi:MAG: cation-translocating P-type ATPase [Waddliaceae bacterium]
MVKDTTKNCSLCTLCANRVGNNPISDGNQVFCCIGCHAVFQILSSRDEKDNFRDHALFKQALQSGLISNPALLQQIQQSQAKLPENEYEKLYFEVQDLWCPSCAEIIRLMVQKEKGVRRCVVDYTTDLAFVDYAPRYLSKEAIFAKIKKIGYKASALEDSEQKGVNFSLYLRFIIAAFFSLNIMMFSYPIYSSYFHSDDCGSSRLFAWISFFASLPVIGYSGWPIIRRCWNSLKAGVLGMEILIVMGVLAAFGLSFRELLRGGNHVYFDSMTVIITFVLLGKMMESKAKFSAKECLFRLARATPKRGRKRFANGTERFVPLKEIKKEDVVVVFSGEKIVLDGIVLEGSGSCDESVMTGEVIPVQKKTGDGVLAGTVLNRGWLAYRAAATEKSTGLHQIIEAIEGDLDHKTVYSRAVDPVIRRFVPLVFVIALGTLIGCWLQGSSLEHGMIRAISVLFISCPCAVGIAAPLAESQLLRKLANVGAIVRNRGCLSHLGRETVCVFDKTGTITEGHFQLIGGVEALTRHEKKILKGLASQSNHPVSCAISQAIEEDAVKLSTVEEVVGHGMRGDDSRALYCLGSEKFMRQMGIPVMQQHKGSSSSIASCVYFSRNDRVLTMLSLGDRVREGAVEMLKSLRAAETVLLSGDQEFPVKAVSKACGMTTCHWECHPLEKRQHIERFREKGDIVCMMGDGMNDAPALTGAHVGISVVSATDISIQVSDIMLTTDRLDVIPKIRALAKKGRKIVHQNLFWAFFYNVIGIGLAAAGYLHPLFSASAMVASSCIVLLNAKRVQ